MSGNRCYACFRPKSACFCPSIPRIDNRTEVLILQHRRERFHPFNTARIVHKALGNSQLLADHTCNLALRLRLSPHAALLYPGPTARLLSELPSDQHPQQLVILDGTWHHVKTLLREIPALQSLPRYQLVPTTPSRYRIRREPTATSLSTVEAAVAALRILEPDTDGFDLLLRAFDTMVENQISHARPADAHRLRNHQSQTLSNIALAILLDLNNIVVAYGEAPKGERGRKRTGGPPISWVAQRLGSGETFSCLLTPPQHLDDGFLRNLALTRADFATAVSLDEARQQWAQFQRPTDVVTVFNPGTSRLHSYLTGHRDSCLVLKSVNLNLIPRKPALEEFSSTPGIPFATLQIPGRAGLRLANTIAFVRYLNALANAQVPLNRGVHAATVNP